MGVERFARKSFGFVMAFLLGLAIYFQASGAVELVASSALAAAPAPAGGKSHRPRRKLTVPAARPANTNGDAILARNPFDSATGPIDRTPPVVDTPEANHPADVTDPLHAPECEDVAVNIVTESQDAAWSLAQLKGPGDPDAATRRVGDDVGKMKVAYIGFNAEKGSPAVWLLSNEKLCQALLFSEKKDKAEATAGGEAAPAAPPPADSAAARRAARAKASGAPGVPPEIASKIQKVSETEFNVDRSVVDGILENQAQLMRSARIVPEQKDGKTVGIRLFGIRADTLLGSLGLQNGDRLEQINGYDIANPEKALEAFAHLRQASELTVALNRRGAPTTLAIHIK